MKLRTDFVTNSSSSSFVAIQLKGKTIASIFQKHREAVQSFFSEENDYYGGLFLIEDDTVVIDQQEPDGSIGDYVPHEKDEIITSIALMLTHGMIEDESDLAGSDCDEKIVALLRDLFRNRNGVLESTEAVSWRGGDYEMDDDTSMTREYSYSADEGEKYNDTGSDESNDTYFDDEEEPFYDEVEKAELMGMLSIKSLRSVKHEHVKRFLKDYYSWDVFKDPDGTISITYHGPFLQCSFKQNEFTIDALEEELSQIMAELGVDE